MEKKYYPLKLKGEFDLGFALGYHTYPGSTERTPLGENLYQLKYCHNEAFVNEIVEIAVPFIISNRVFSSCDLIIPMPPSKSRKLQPVLRIARGIKVKTGKFVAEYTISKLKETPELKDIKTYEEKKEIIKGVYGFASIKARRIVKGKKVLVIDDLYDTGATSNEITRILKEEGQASGVYILAITKTKGQG